RMRDKSRLWKFFNVVPDGLGHLEIQRKRTSMTMIRGGYMMSKENHCVMCGRPIEDKNNLIVSMKPLHNDFYAAAARGKEVFLMGRMWSTASDSMCSA
ncbi:hypothetical protein, partial [Alicyclobacillus shizuokensis]|uniref:hypothetical protein n=1 Tax=Alicyclobacillus shizuokensis TaxID=392014 RepID=UPI001C3F19C1